MTVRMTISKRELHTILAALRTWQRATYEDQRRHDEIASSGGTVRPLSDREIDLLCERINTSGE